MGVIDRWLALAKAGVPVRRSLELMRGTSDGHDEAGLPGDEGEVTAEGEEEPEQEEEVREDQGEEEVMDALKLRLELIRAQAALAWNWVLKWWTRNGKHVIVSAITLIVFLALFALLGSA